MYSALSRLSGLCCWPLLKLNLFEKKFIILLERSFLQKFASDIVQLEFIFLAFSKLQKVGKSLAKDCKMEIIAILPKNLAQRQEIAPISKACSCNNQFLSSSNYSQIKRKFFLLLLLITSKETQKRIKNS